jgi:chromosome partitioning protein
MEQVRLLIASNAGGSGKTTTALHLAYELARLGKKVTIVELDHNGSICAFTGLGDDPEPARTLHKLWDNFDGKDPLESFWAEYAPNLSVIRGGHSIERISREISTRGRGFYFLADTLEDYPLAVDVIIFDTPATLEPMGIPGYLAATHILCPIKPEIKDAEMVAQLITWTTQKNKEFRLKHPPHILGFLPTRVDYSQSVHRNILGVDEKGQALQNPPEDCLPRIFKAIGMNLFPPVRQSAYYLTACQEKRPLPALNSRTAKNQDYRPIAALIESILNHK